MKKPHKLCLDPLQISCTVHDLESSYSRLGGGNASAALN